jgi:hypothetical protein
MRRELREPKSARGAALRVERELAIGRERIEKSSRDRLWHPSDPDV